MVVTGRHQTPNFSAVSQRRAALKGDQPTPTSLNATPQRDKHSEATSWLEP